MINPYLNFDDYGIRYLLVHLIQAEAWEGLEQIFADTDFIEAKCTAGMSYELVVDYNEGILHTPDAFRLLENIWNGLSRHHTELLQPLLHRFLYVATVPNQQALKRVPKEQEIEFSSRFRLPHPTYWSPMIQFLDGHRKEVSEWAPNEVAIIAEKWLMQNQSQSYQKEAAELGLTAAWRVFQEIQQEYYSKTADPKIAYRAVLASVPVLPERAIELILTACGRQESPFPASQPEPLPELFPQVEIPPWPDGPRWRVDHDFQELCLDEPTVLMPLMALYPKVAEEVILALLIREPGRRIADLNYRDFERDYEINDYLRHGPPFYTHGPFLFFLAIHPEVGLDVILRLVNFVTEQWKDRWEEQLEKSSFVTIPFPTGERRWFGEWRLYALYRNAPGFPDSIVTALMALEQWFYTHLDKEELIAYTIETILEQTQSVAFAGLLICIGKKLPELFKGPLKSLLAVPEFYVWETHLQGKIEPYQMVGWSSYTHTEQQKKEAQEWHNMPHRTRDLHAIAQLLFLKDEHVRACIERAREQWQIRLQESLPDDPFYEHLKKSIWEFDIRNWKQEEHPKYGRFWRFWPPKDFLEQFEHERPQFLAQDLLLVFPFTCQQRLSENQPLATDELEDFWNSLQRIEQFTEEELEDFSQHVQQHREYREFGLSIDDPDFGKRHVRNALCAGVTVLIHLHREWLCKHPEKEEWCIQILAETLLSPPLASPFDCEASINTMNWDNFCAYAIPILWAEAPDSEVWRNFVVRLVAHPHHMTAKILFLQAVKYQHALGDDFFRLQHLILLSSWARWHWSPRRFKPQESERKRKARRKRVSKQFDKVAKTFIDGTLSTELPSWEALAAHERRQPRHISKKLYFRPDPGLDLAYIQAAFEGFPLPAEAKNTYEKQRSMAFWKEALCCVLRMLGNGDEEIEEFHDTPDDFEDWVFGKIVSVILQLDSSVVQQTFWKPILNLGTPAHHWIEHFLLNWFLYGLTSHHDDDVFIKVWREMLDFASHSSKWAYNSQRGSHALDDLWSRLLGLDGNLLHLWSKERMTIVTQMRDYYKQWASFHLLHDYSTSVFTEFLQTPAAKNIRLDGLIWLEQAVSSLKRAFRDKEPEDLARLLVFYWQNHRTRLRQHSRYWEAFTSFLQHLVRQGNNIAIELSGRISPESSK